MLNPYSGNASSAFEGDTFLSAHQDGERLKALQHAQAYQQEQERKRSRGGLLGGILGTVAGVAASAIPGVGAFAGPIIGGAISKGFSDS